MTLLKDDEIEMTLRTVNIELKKIDKAIDGLKASMLEATNMDELEKDNIQD